MRIFDNFEICHTKGRKSKKLYIVQNVNFKGVKVHC